MTLLAEYDALNLQDFHMHLEVGSQAIVYRTPNELCAHSKFDKHTFPPFISEIAECEVWVSSFTHSPQPFSCLKT